MAEKIKRSMVLLLTVIILGGCTTVNSYNSGSSVSSIDMPTTSTVSSTPTNTQPMAYVTSGLAIPTKEEQEKFYYVRDTSTVGDVHPLGIVPYNYSLERAQEQGLATKQGFTEEFFFVQALYRKTLEEYLAKRLDLNGLSERFIKENADNFLRATNKETDRVSYYRRYSNLATPYFYIRNNIYLSRLSTEQLQVFRDAYLEKQTEITDEMRTIVKETWVDAIKPFNDDAKEVTYGLYTPVDPNKKTYPNKSLVLYFSYRMTEEYPYSNWTKETITQAQEFDKYVRENLIPQFESEMRKEMPEIPVYLE